MDTLKSIINKQLISVTFILDYIQFDFDEVDPDKNSDRAKITAVTNPMIVADGAELHWGMPGYCDLLCKQIGSIVRDISVTEGEAFQIKMDNDATISISLKPEDYCGPEAVIVDLKNGGWGVW